MTFLALWLLATTDAAFIGYREAAGRNALIGKRAYYRKAMLRGALFGQAAVAIVGSVGLILLAFSSEPYQLLEKMEGAGLRMLIVFVPYALVLSIGFLVRLVPSVDIRSITSVLIFGPFTLIRPLVVVVGVTLGTLGSASWILVLLGVLIVSCMLGMEWLIGRLRKARAIA